MGPHQRVAQHLARRAVFTLRRVDEAPDGVDVALPGQALRRVGVRPVVPGVHAFQYNRTFVEVLGRVRRPERGVAQPRVSVLTELAEEVEPLRRRARCDTRVDRRRDVARFRLHSLARHLR